VRSSNRLPRLLGPTWILRLRTIYIILGLASRLLSLAQSGRGTRNAKKPLNCFQGCHKNALNESCKMSPHLIGLGWHPRSLLWLASGSGLDMIWKLKSQLRPIKWGLILKLSSRPFLSHPWNPLRGFFAFRIPLPDCVGILTTASSFSCDIFMYPNLYIRTMW